MFHFRISLLQQKSCRCQQTCHECQGVTALIVFCHYLDFRELLDDDHRICHTHTHVELSQLFSEFVHVICSWNVWIVAMSIAEFEGFV